MAELPIRLVDQYTEEIFGLGIGITNLVFDAVNWGYQIVLPRDAVAGVPPEYAAAVMENTLSLVATLSTTAAVVDVWSAAASESRLMAK